MQYQLHIHVLAELPHGLSDSMIQRVEQAIMEEIPASARNSWASFPATAVPGEADSREFARWNLDRAIMHINNQRGDDAFSIHSAPADRVKYIYHNETVSCVYASELWFQNEAWTVSDPGRLSERVFLRLQATWAAGKIGGSPSEPKLDESGQVSVN